MVDRGVRSLSNISATASSSRVLHLLGVALKHEGEDEYQNRPLFENRLLNQSIIIRHRLRRDELELFSPMRTVATKVLTPIDRNDLDVGGRYLFVGQRHYDSLLREHYGRGGGLGAQDQAVLAAIDELPTLDPFILREHLARRGFKPAACYFDISSADLSNMLRFVREALKPLIEITFARGRDPSVRADILVNKILANDSENDLEPLRQVLRLDKAQYSEGLFCWKGFLYYKWLVGDLYDRCQAISEEIAETRLIGPCDHELRSSISQLKTSIIREIAGAADYIRRSLSVYDRAFKALTEAGDPIAFRDFLLSSPAMFLDLGERLAAIQHIVSFWRFRFAEGAKAAISGPEFYDLLVDFEAGLPQAGAYAPSARSA